MTGIREPQLRVVFSVVCVLTLACAGRAFGQVEEVDPRLPLARLPEAIAEPPIAQSPVERLQALEEEVAVLRAAALKAKEADAKKKAAEEEEKKKGYVIGSDTGMASKWTNDGGVMQSKHGDFKYHVRGVAQFDYITFDNPSAGTTVPSPFATKDSVGFRRLRIGMEGTMYEVIDWVLEGDFAFALQNVDPTASAAPITGLRASGGFNQSGNVINVFQPTTTFVNFKEVPYFGNIRIGNYQDWIGMEHIESARFLDFMERAPIMDAFNGPNNNAYAPGISMINNTDDMRAGLQAGIFKNNAYDGGVPYNLGNNNYTYNARVIGTPYYDEPSNGRYLVHLGLGSELRIFDNEPGPNQAGTNVRVRSRGDLRNTSSTLTPNYVDTGNFFANNQFLIDPELVVQWGPWLWRNEFDASFFNGAAAFQGGPAIGTAFMQGGYSEVLYFITGENRAYNRQIGVFNRVVPIENASWSKDTGFCGLGAWQAGIRYDWLNLNSGIIQGGRNQNLTLGLNWFLNPNCRFQMNYVFSWFENGPQPGVTFPGPPVPTAPTSLVGSRFGGTGSISSWGTRLDWNF